ncbi:MAG: hypothetical protein WCI18_03205 [Pseudomonadota bacterium]
MSHGERNWLGLHLAGVNTAKSAVVSFAIRAGIPEVVRMVDRVGPLGKVTADERLLEIISQCHPSDAIFVDTPLSSPPCVSCIETVCHGAMSCSDIRVAYISALAQKAGARRRPVDPQAHRVWDVLQMQDRKFVDPTYTSNHAPLVIRAQVLEKRLRVKYPHLRFKETHISMALMRMAGLLKLSVGELKQFRKFENGLQIRQKIVTSMLENRLAKMSPSQFENVSHSLEAFLAFISAWLCVQDYLELLQPAPRQYRAVESWVWLPK